PFQWCQSHRSIDRAAILDRAGRAAVAEMERDHVGLISGDVAQLAIAVSDIAMRSAVKAITAQPVAAIELIGQRVEKSLLGQGVMKRSIEDCRLRQRRAEDLTGRDDAFNIGGIMERRQLDTFFNAAHDLVSDER